MTVLTEDVLRLAYERIDAWGTVAPDSADALEKVALQAAIAAFIDRKEAQEAQHPREDQRS